MYSNTHLGPIGASAGIVTWVPTVLIPAGTELGGLPNLPHYTVETLQILNRPLQNYIAISIPIGATEWEFAAQLGSAVALSGGTIQLFVKKQWTTTYWQPMPYPGY